MVSFKCLFKAQRGKKDSIIHKKKIREKSKTMKNSVVDLCELINVAGKKEKQPQPQPATVICCLHIVASVLTLILY